LRAIVGVIASVRMRVNSATFRGLIVFTFEKLTRIIRQKKQEGLDVFSDSDEPEKRPH